MEEFFADEVVGEGHTLEDAALVKLSEVYLAVRDEDTDEVRALAGEVQFRNTNGYRNFYYDLHSEAGGPAVTRAPKRILEQLTDPPPNDIAARWRKRCWESWHERTGTPRLSDGDWIVLREPARVNGDPYRVLRVNRDQDGRGWKVKSLGNRKTTFETPDGRRDFYLRRYRDRDWIRVEEPADLAPYLEADHPEPQLSALEALEQLQAHTDRDWAVALDREALMPCLGAEDERVRQRAIQLLPYLEPEDRESDRTPEASEPCEPQRELF